MFFLLLLAIRVHSQSSVWIDLSWSARGQSAHDLFFLCSSFCDICSSFHALSLFFLLFVSSVFLLGWGSALVPSGLASILINDCCGGIQLAAGSMLREIAFRAGSRDPSLSGREVVQQNPKVFMSYS